MGRTNVSFGCMPVAAIEHLLVVWEPRNKTKGTGNGNEGLSSRHCAELRWGNQGFTRYMVTTIYFTLATHPGKLRKGIPVVGSIRNYNISVTNDCGCVCRRVDVVQLTQRLEYVLDSNVTRSSSRKHMRKISQSRSYISEFLNYKIMANWQATTMCIFCNTDVMRH